MEFLYREGNSTNNYGSSGNKWQPGYSSSANIRGNDQLHNFRLESESGGGGDGGGVSSAGFSREMYRAAINSRVGSLDLSGMSEFKQGVIRRTLSQYRRISQRETIPNPSRKYSMEYNAEKDELHVGGIQVLINDTTSSLECAHCSYRSELMSPKKASFTEYRMFYHILIKHLQVFRCSICGLNRQNYKSYAHHISQFHNLRLGTRAERNNRVVNNRRVKPVYSNTIDKPFQCNVCGKKFIQKANLRSHEKIHEMSEVEKSTTIICPGCGKKFSERNFKSAHRKICQGLAGW